MIYRKIKGKLGMPRVWRQGVLWHGDPAVSAHQVPTGKKTRCCPFVTLSSLPRPVRNQSCWGRGRRQESLARPPPSPDCCSRRCTRLDLAPEPYSKARRPFVLGTRGPGEKSARGLGFSGPLLSWELQINAGCGSSLGIVTRLALRVYTAFCLHCRQIKHRSEV